MNNSVEYDNEYEQKNTNPLLLPTTLVTNVGDMLATCWRRRHIRPIPSRQVFLADMRIGADTDFRVGNSRQADLLVTVCTIVLL